MFERHEELELGLFFFYPMMDINYSFLFTLEIEISRSHTIRQSSKGKTVQESTEAKSQKKEQTSFSFSPHPYFLQVLPYLSDE